MVTITHTFGTWYVISLKIRLDEGFKELKPIKLEKWLILNFFSLAYTMPKTLKKLKSKGES